LVSLTDRQLAAVMDAARPLPVERRDTFLQRVGAMLRVRGRFTDSDVIDVTQLAMAGLVQTAEASCALAWRQRDVDRSKCP
jgi:hypothetical protein